MKRRLGLLAAHFGKVWQAGGYSEIDDRELMRRAEHLAARLPVLYVIFALSALLIAITFSSTANLVQGILAPLAFIAICVFRAHYWRGTAVRQRDRKILRSDIARLQLVGPGLVVFATCWIMSLYPAATPSQQGIIYYVIGITTTSGMLTMIDTPRTAILGGAAALLPFCSAVLFFGSPGHALIALCQVLVTGLLTVIAVRYYRDLGQLITSARQLRERQIAIEKNAAELEILSSTDPLTGTLNRRAILAIAAEHIADENRPEPWLALLDLDGFKDVNDSYGHAAGDKVLQIVTDRITADESVVRFGRIGGDEFALLFSGEESSDGAFKIAKRLAQSIAQPMEIGGFVLRLRASIGLRKTERLTLSECLERADFALFKAKQGDEPIALFDAEQEQELIQRNRVAAEFKEADLNKALEIEFQPIVDFDTRRVLSVEALARWKRNDSSIVMPHIFIALAESTGRITEITDRMIEKALRFAASWPEEVDVQINLSARDLLRNDLIDHVAASIARENITPQRIAFEVTESTLVTNPAKGASTIAQLRALGCKVALDDFGTGYSSLAYLDRFTFDQIKLDREFARKLTDKSPATAVASTVFTLSQQLNADCTIEGIETDQQALIARRLGIRRMQGFYFAKPLKHEALLETLGRDQTVDHDQPSVSPIKMKRA